MTTIVYRDGVMASDTRAYSGDKNPIGNKQKAWRMDDGSLMGISTTIPGLGEAIMEAMNTPDVPLKEFAKEVPELNFTALRVRSNGDVFYYNNTMFPAGPLTAPFFAIGTGSDFALGAMSAGCTAEAALVVAGEHDVWSAGQANILSLVEEPMAPNVSPDFEEAVIVDPTVNS